MQRNALTRVLIFKRRVLQFNAGKQVFTRKEKVVGHQSEDDEFLRLYQQHSDFKHFLYSKNFLDEQILYGIDGMNDPGAF